MRQEVTTSLVHDTMPPKRHVTDAERYAVWSVHEQRCWLCRAPLELRDLTIDHVIPERLLEKPGELEQVLQDLGLPAEFNVDGPENWLPSHLRCNREKSENALIAPVARYLLGRMICRAPEVSRRVALIRRHVKRDRSFAMVRVAIEDGVVTLEDLRQLGIDLSPAPVAEEANIVLLQDGHWVFRKDVVYEGLCECERTHCVDSDTKVLCVFATTLSPWVIAKRLYWKCYDEIIVCPRCTQRHMRGQVGRTHSCGNPYRDQSSQTDWA